MHEYQVYASTNFLFTRLHVYECINSHFQSRRLILNGTSRLTAELEVSHGFSGTIRLLFGARTFAVYKYVYKFISRIILSTNDTGCRIKTVVTNKLGQN